MIQLARAARSVALVGLALATGCNPVKSPEDKELRFDPALFRSPPEVAGVSIQMLTAPNDEGNARLRVRFKEQMERRTLVIRSGARPTLLRDDGVGADERAGDGVFSAFVSFDAAGYEAELKRRAERPRKSLEVPVFKNQEIVGKKRVEPPRPMRLPPGEIRDIFPFDPDPFAVDPARELLITDVSVVDDPSRTFNPCTETGSPDPETAILRPWTFGRLMTEMANQPVTGIHPSDFTLHWLQQWSTNIVINGFTVGHRLARLNSLILNPWPKLSDGRLDLEKAPFRLLAIVNRIDLRGSTAYGSGNAGEARFVFGLLRCGAPPEAQEFLVILEYGINKSSCSAVRDWAQQWRALGSIVLGSPGYNPALQAITDQFTLRNADPSKPPNRSALNQLRSNEFALLGADAFWQLREFRICGSGVACTLGQLEGTTIAQTPDRTFDGEPSKQPLLSGYVNTNASAVLADTHVIPLQLPPSTPFRAGEIQPGVPFTWDPGGITNPEARHGFALATCNGCHTTESRTDFVHISKRNAGSPTTLSDFLTGLNQPKTDPVSGVPRTFHALLDRQAKLDAAANMFCPPFLDAFPFEDLFPVFFLPPGFPH